MTVKIALDLVHNNDSIDTPYISNFEIRILVSIGEGSTYRTGGIAHITRVDIEACQNDGIPPIDVFNESKSLYDFIDTCDENGIKDSVEDSISRGKPFANILTVINRLEVLPEYRGVGLAKALFDEMYNLSGVYGIIALKAFPMQFESISKNHAWKSRMRYDLMNKSYAESLEDLISHYCNRLEFCEWNGDILLR